MINKLLLWEKVPSAGSYVETIRHWIKSTVLLWSPSVPNSRDYFSGFSRNMTYIIMRICFIACIFYHLAFLQFLMEPLNVTNGTTFVLKPRKGVKKKIPPFISLDWKCCQDTSGSVNVLWFITSLESSTSTRKSEHFGWQNVYTEICHYQGTKLSLQWDCQCCVSFRAGTVPNKNPRTAGGQEETNRRQTGGKQEAVTRSSVISTESYTCNCSHFFMISFKSDSAYSILGRCVGTIMLHNTTVISAKDHMDIKHWT